MQKPTSATLLVGSPKGPSSTSNSLGTYLLDKLQEHGLKTQKVFVCQCLNSDKNRAALLNLIDESDLIVLAFPLYVDSLHSQAIETLELVAKHEKTKSEHDKKSFAAIANSGFPEAKHSDTALQVCRLFAKQAGFNWAGGLAMGGGGMIAGLPLDEMGGQARNQKKALEIAAEALARGEPIPEDAVVLMSKLGFPRWLYIWMGNRGWKQEAKKHISIKKMYDQPCREA
jgi:multimeric flavodoxin WrbA